MSTKLRKLVAKKLTPESTTTVVDVADASEVTSKKRAVPKKSEPIVVAVPQVVANEPVAAYVEPVVEENQPVKLSKVRVVAKSPVKKVVAKSPKKSSPKKSTTKKVSTKKTLVKKNSKKDVSKEKNKVISKKAKSKRAHNTKPATMDTTGIGIGPARVKAVLMNNALNPVEFAVRNAILQAENKPRKPKPTPEVPNPELPAQGPQTPIDQLDPAMLAVIRKAELVHENSLRESYERNYISKVMDDPTRVRYHDERKKAQTTAEENKVEFVLQAFNNTFDKNFYAGYAAYKADNDSYVTGKKFTDAKTNSMYEKFNEWTRATALVNKLCTRLSGNTRNIIACFLDRIVEQYARNGIHNCLLEGRHIVQLRHALAQDEGFASRVPLDPFVQTLSNYSAAIDWLDACRKAKEQARQHKADGEDVTSELPPYPNPEYDYDFEGYVGEICRSVKMQMAESKTTDAEKATYLETSVGHEFKQFCSYVVYEAILRIGSSLRLSVERQGVKTISDTMVNYVLQQIHSVCGIDYTITEKAMTERLNRFNVWRSERKNERRRKRDTGDAGDDDEEGEEVEADDAEHDTTVLDADEEAAEDGDEVEIEYETQ
jgi:hypothetical protein